MRDKLQKVKTKLSSKKRRFSAFDSSVDGSRNTSCAAEISTQASLLGLPPEIRNVIYEELANNTVLTLSISKGRKGAPPIGLLLACKQTFREFRTLLLTQAMIALHVTDYNFSNVVRAFERMNETDISILSANSNLWIELYFSHVPSRDDRQALRAWCEYRSNQGLGPYFKSGRRVPQDMIFQYAARFSSQIRPPRPTSRYANGYQMKYDILRTHVRMTSRLHIGNEETPPNEELKRIKTDLEECAKIFENLHLEASQADAG